jgi:hypothetical protein
MRLVTSFIEFHRIILRIKWIMFNTESIQMWSWYQLLIGTPWYLQWMRILFSCVLSFRSCAEEATEGSCFCELGDSWWLLFSALLPWTTISQSRNDSQKVPGELTQSKSQVWMCFLCIFEVDIYLYFQILVHFLGSCIFNSAYEEKNINYSITIKVLNTYIVNTFLYP